MDAGFLTTTIVVVLLLVDFVIRVIAIIVVPRNRKPTSATAWLLAIFLIPYIGVLFFLLIGSYKLPKKRREKQDEINRFIIDSTEGIERVRRDHPWPPWLESVVELNRNLGAMPLVGGNRAQLNGHYEESLAAMTAAIGEANGKHGPARILVNCAGVGPAKRIVGRDGPMPLADFERVIKINLIGTFNALRLAAADMQGLSPLEDGERGVIISTASVAAYEGQVGQAAYAASKGGVVALTLPAAREFAQFGIRVLAIAPGIFGTPMLRALPQEAQDSLGAAVPFPKRLGEPREFAALVLHCIHNAYLNGEVIRLDGALRMAPR